MENIDHQGGLDEKKPAKRREDLVPESYLLKGEWVEVFNLTEAAIYLGMSRDNLQKTVEKRRNTDKPIPTFQKAEGGKGTYFLKSTLDDMMRIVPKE